MEFFFFFLIVE